MSGFLFNDVLFRIDTSGGIGFPYGGGNKAKKSVDDTPAAQSDGAAAGVEFTPSAH